MVSLSRIMNWVLGATILVGTAFVSLHYWLDEYAPPVKYLSIAVLNKEVHAGDILSLRTTADRRRNCPGKVSRFIARLSSDGKESEAIYSDKVSISPTAIGESISNRFNIKLPDKMDVGTYVYRAEARFECDGRIFTLEIPAAGFVVN